MREKVGRWTVRDEMEKWKIVRAHKCTNQMTIDHTRPTWVIDGKYRIFFFEKKRRRKENLLDFSAMNQTPHFAYHWIAERVSIGIQVNIIKEYYVYARNLLHFFCVRGTFDPTSQGKPLLLQHIWICNEHGFKWRRSTIFSTLLQIHRRNESLVPFTHTHTHWERQREMSAYLYSQCTIEIVKCCAVHKARDKVALSPVRLEKFWRMLANRSFIWSGRKKHTHSPKTPCKTIGPPRAHTHTQCTL